MNVCSHSCHDCNCVHSTSSLATGLTRWKAVTSSNAYRRLPFQSLTASVFVAHRSDVCRYTLAFYRSYSERHVAYTSKCSFRRDPCNKVLDRFRPCSGVDCQPGGCTHDTRFSIIVSAVMTRALAVNVKWRYCWKLKHEMYNCKKFLKGNSVSHDFNTNQDHSGRGAFFLARQAGPERIVPMPAFSTLLLVCLRALVETPAGTAMPEMIFLSSYLIMHITADTCSTENVTSLYYAVCHNYRTPNMV